MAKNQKPLFATMLTGNAAEEKEPIEERAVKEEPTPEDATPVETPEEAEEAEETVIKPVERKKKENEPKLYIKGEPVRAILIHLSIDLFDKISAISAFEGMTKRSVINQAVSHCIAVYEKNTGNLKTRKRATTKNIFD